MVSLRKVSDHQFEETDRRSGKVVYVSVWTASADGKTIAMSDTDPIYDTKSTYVMEKQP